MAIYMKVEMIMGFEQKISTHQKLQLSRVQGFHVATFINTFPLLLIETHNQIDHVLVDKRRHSNIIVFKCFRVPDCDNDHYVLAARFRKRLSVSKRAAQTFDIQRCNYRNQNDLEVKEQYQVKMSSRFAASEALDDNNDNVDINRVWKSIRDNKKLQSQRVEDIIS